LVVSTKPDGSPVTSADLAADAAIRATLCEAFPGDAILTEEGVDDGARLSSRRCWIGDPLDATSHFVAGSDDFDTFVALAVNGVPAVGVILQGFASRRTLRLEADDAATSAKILGRGRRCCSTPSARGQTLFPRHLPNSASAPRRRGSGRRRRG